MRGLLWAGAGAVVGGALGLLVMLAVVKLADIPSREGASGYAVIGGALLGAMAGVVLALVWFARAAPAGERLLRLGTGTLGVIGAIAAVALLVWGWMQLREAPLEYGNALATLELELRLPSAELPDTSNERWLSVEVQTANSRPVGTVLWSDHRIEGAHVIVPVIQQPLMRALGRTIVVEVAGQRVEIFRPSIPRVPDPRADWSAWTPPVSVEPPYGVTPAAPLRPVLELRYRVRQYGD